MSVSTIAAVVSSAVLAVLFTNEAHLLYLSLLAGSLTLLICSLVNTKRSFKSNMKWAFLSFLCTNLFTPCILDSVPASVIRAFGVKFQIGTEIYPNLQDKTFESVIEYNDIHSFTEAKEIMNDAYYPVVFRGLMNNSVEVGQTILNRLDEEDIHLRVAKFDVDGPYDWIRGTPHTRNNDEAVAPKTAMAENSPYFAAFEPFLTNEEVQDIAGDILSGNYLFDTNFLSNFNKTVLTSGTHGASVITSWSLQMMGSKSWFLWDPVESRKIHRSWWGRTTLPAWGSEKDLFDRKTYKVRLDAGDVMAFPPFWMHAVTTHAGPNLMLNLRTLIGYPPFGGDWLCGLRIGVSAPLTALLKFLPQMKVIPSNALLIDGLRQVFREDIKVAFTEAPEKLRNGPVDQFL